jgi:hypothetical protein
MQRLNLEKKRIQDANVMAPNTSGSIPSMQVLQNISQHFRVFLHCSQETDIRILAQRQGLLLL